MTTIVICSDEDNMMLLEDGDVKEFLQSQAIELREEFNGTESIEKHLQTYAQFRSSDVIKTRVARSDDETVVGFACLHKVNPSTFELKRVVVRDEFRRQGIGRRMVRSLIEEEVDLNTQRVVLETLEVMKPAIAMYESLGFKLSRSFKCKDGCIVRSYTIGSSPPSSSSSSVKKKKKKKTTTSRTQNNKPTVGKSSNIALSTNMYVRLESESKSQYLDVVLEVTRKKDDTIIRMARRTDPYRRLICDQNGRVKFDRVKGMKNAEFLVRPCETKDLIELYSMGHKKKSLRLCWSCSSSSSSTFTSSSTHQFSTCDHSNSSTKIRVHVLSRNAFHFENDNEDNILDHCSKENNITKEQENVTSIKSPSTNVIDDGYMVFKSIIPPKQIQDALYTINHALGTNQVVSGGVRFLTHPILNHRYLTNRPSPPTHTQVQGDPYIKLSTKLSTHRNLMNLYPERLIREHFVDDPERPSSCQVALRFPETKDSLITLHDDSWHTDGERKSCRHPFTLLVGVCLSDCYSEKNRGSLAVWSGQHVNPKLHVRPDIGKPVQVFMRKGDVVICHSELPHAGAPNRSSDIRYMVYFRVRHRYMKRLLENAPLDPFADLTLLHRQHKTKKCLVLSHHHIDTFKRDGVVVVKNILTKDQAKYFREEFKRSLGINNTSLKKLDTLSSTHTGVLDVFYSKWKLRLTMTCEKYANAYADLLEHTYGMCLL